MRSPRCSPEPDPAPQRPATGFTLVEIALALGVVGFALAAILSLLPVALNAADESRNQARATLISQMVFSDLRSGVFTNAPVTVWQKDNGDRSQVGLDLSSNVTQSVHIAYDCDGLPLGNLSLADYSKGFSGPAARPASFLARIRTMPHPSIPGLARIELSVEQPAPAAQTARRSYLFATQIAR